MRDNGHILPQEDSIPHARKAAPKPGLKKSLRGSSAWYFLPAIAMAVTAGVTLNASPARAQTAIGNQTSTYIIPGAAGSSFYLAPPNTIVATTGSPGSDAAIVINGQSLFNYSLIANSDSTGIAAVVIQNGGGYLFNGTPAGSAAYGGANANGGTGTIINYLGLAVDLGSAAVTVVNGGSIYGFTTGITGANSGDSVSNTGTIQGLANVGVYLTAGGHVTNSGTGSYIYGGSIGVQITTAAGYVSNAGTILSAGTGVVLADGGSVYNSGTITGTGSGGIQGNGAYITVINTGTVIANAIIGAGVFVFAGGSIYNSGSITGYDGVNITAGGVGIVTNSGTITGNGTSSGGNGVVLSAGGTVTNNSGGTISGYHGVYLTTGGSVNNSGTIIGAGAAGIYNKSGDFTLTNTGTVIGTGSLSVNIQGTGTDKVILGAGYAFTGAISVATPASATLEWESGVNGTLSNGAEFTYFGTIVVDSGATLTNNTSQTLASGYTLSNSGTVTNSSILIGLGTVTNAGTFTNASTGVITTTAGSQGIAFLQTAGTLTNAGSIYGSVYGVSASAGSIVNTGTINGGTAAGYAGVVLNGGVYVNNSSGTITGYYGVWAKTGAGTVSNGGTIRSTGSGNAADGIYFSQGGTVTNSSTASYIYGNNKGVVINGNTGTVTNLGTIIGFNGRGVLLNAGGSINNSGTISGATGVYAGTNVSTVSNTGTILGTSTTFGTYGVFLDDGGTVTNTGGTITGFAGVAISTAAPGTVINTGLISYNGQHNLNAIGVSLADGGTVTNTGGTITGYAYGVKITNGDGSVNNTGTITSAATQGAGVKLSFGVDTVINTGTITGHQGVYLAAGYVKNGSTVATNAYIGGGSAEGVYINGSATLVNYGTVKGTGVNLHSGGTIDNKSSGYIGNGGGQAVQGLGLISLTNAGTIQGGNGGVIGGALSVFNYGTITGGTDFGVKSNSGGFVQNGNSTITNAVISGANTAVSLTNAGTVSNFGTITGTGMAVGVQLAAGGTVTNSGTAAKISGAYGVQASGVATVTNYGIIIGTGDVGVLLNTTGSYVGNLGTGAHIFGNNEGVKIAGSGTVFNQGRIIADYTSGNSAAGVSLTNGGTVTNSGTSSYIYGFDGVLISGAAGTVLNQGNINSGRVGVNLTAGGTVTNSGTGSSIYGYTSAVVIAGGTGTVINAGYIHGNNDQGVELDAGGAITNSGTIYGFGHGVYVKGAAATINNTGTILGITDQAVKFAGTTTGLTLTNYGTITGEGGVAVGTTTASSTIVNTGLISSTNTSPGISTSGLVTITNSGTISTTGTGTAVSAQAGGTLTNTGVISGGAGVSGAGTSFTLANYGAIISTTGTAIKLGATSNIVILGTGTSIVGAVNGQAQVSTITLKGTGTLSSTFTNFAAGSTLTVASGANWIASGSWTIPSVTNAGTLQPGVSGSPLNLTGNFTEGSGSTLQSVLLSDGTGSKLAVTGAANISNSLSSIIEPAGLAGAATRTYTLVSATGGVNGMFSGVTGGTALLPATLSYDADDAYVTLTQRSVVDGTSGGAGLPTGSGRTADELAFAQAFDAGYAANPIAFGPALGALDQIQTAAGVDAALDTLSGQNNADLADMAILQNFDFITLFQQHSFTTKGNTDQDDPWVTGFAQSASQDGSPAGALKLNEGITGGVIGADHVFFPGFRLGLMLGMGQEHASVGSGGGMAKVTFEEGAATADYTDGNLYADLLVGYGASHGTTTRNVSLPGLPATATAHPKSDAILAGGEMGYTLVSDDVASLIPFVSFDYSTTRQHGYTETGAAALDLVVTAHTDQSERSVIGTRVNFGGWSIGDVPMTVETKIGWAHEFAALNPLVSESFAAQAGTNFTLSGAPLPGDSALVGLGLTAALSSNATIHLRYDGGYSSTTLSHMISGGISIDW